MAKDTITVSGIRQDEWVNPFGATSEELVASALEENGLMEKKTAINGKDAHAIFQSYCKKKNLFQEATKLGNILLKENLIFQEQLTTALHIQAETGKPLGEVLVEKNFCTPDDIQRALERQQAIREDFYRMEQLREARRNFWKKIIRFLFDSRETV